jgi:hypothetical protein
VSGASDATDIIKQVRLGTKLQDYLGSKSQVKIRVGFDKTLHSFPSRREAFAWVKENYDPPQTISVLTYEFGELESGERYFYQNDNFIREHIVE